MLCVRGNVRHLFFIVNPKCLTFLDLILINVLYLIVLQIKKKERAKRAVPHGDSQVGNAFTFMRKRRQDLTLGAKVKVSTVQYT